MEPAPGTLVANRFRLVRELGRGSMGSVWLADHEALGLRCAVKFATAEAESDPAFRGRFEREARAVARLDCPNVVRVLDYDVFEGVPFLAMEWLAGEDLETRLRREGRLEPGEVHRIVSQVAHGLERAHAAGIIHRDLKPGNVFIVSTDSGDVAKILDFGLAKVASRDATAMTQAGSVLGTPVYMSPEQARSVSEVDERSDLWSLAVITYECLLGKLPFDGPSLGEVFARIMFEPIPVPSAVDPTLPIAFDHWWERAASRDVEARFASAPEMAEALGEALGLGERRSRPSSKPDLASVRTVPPRSIRRRGHRLGAIAVAMALMAGATYVPTARHLAVPQPLRSSVDMLMHALADAATRFTARAEAAITPLPSSSAASLDSPLPPPPPAPSHMPAPVLSVGALPAIPTPYPAEAHATATPSVASAVPLRPAAPAVSVEESSESEPALALTTSECRTAQLRCDGRVLQVCNDEHDGWADVTECPSNALCDATGSGGCVATSAMTGNAGSLPPTSEESSR